MSSIWSSGTGPIYVLKVEVERALVEAEQESEVGALQREKEALEELHSKMEDLETKSQQEKKKVEVFTLKPYNCLEIWFEILVSDSDADANFEILV